MKVVHIVERFEANIANSMVQYRFSIYLPDESFSSGSDGVSRLVLTPYFGATRIWIMLSAARRTLTSSRSSSTALITCPQARGIVDRQATIGWAGCGAARWAQRLLASYSSLV